MEKLVEITQIISIVAFVGCAIKFFVQTGQYKAIIEVKMSDLESDIKELKEEVKTQKKDIEDLRQNTNNTTSRLEALMIEIRTRLDVFIKFTGMGKEDVGERH